MSPLQSSSSHAAPPSGVPSASGDLQTGPISLRKFAGPVLVEGIDPVWLENLKRGPKIEEFKQKYVKEQTLQKQIASTVNLVRLQDGTSAPCAPLVCKCYTAWKAQRCFERWASEIAIHKSVSGHPNIVKFHGAFCVEFSSLSCKARCNLVMEWTRESSWDFIAYWHQLKLRDVKHFGTDMCMGLRHIHQFSILHRDMKPANCLLHHLPSKHKVLKICDFGNPVFLTHAKEQ